mmetsp:Transcript_14542/g.61292  ORF Transcript_14542/g.61292 Transcript_14542/m.61292 type:complete len:295 (+) Transcript_14542:1825-2709(+)
MVFFPFGAFVAFRDISVSETAVPVAPRHRGGHAPEQSQNAERPRAVQRVEKHVRVRKRERPGRREGQRERTPIVPFLCFGFALLRPEPQTVAQEVHQTQHEPHERGGDGEEREPRHERRRRGRRRLQRGERIGDRFDSAPRTRDRVQGILRLRLGYRTEKRGVPQHEHRERDRGARHERDFRFPRVALQRSGHHRDDVVEHERERDDRDRGRHRGPVAGGEVLDVHVRGAEEKERREGQEDDADQHGVYVVQSSGRRREDDVSENSRVRRAGGAVRDVDAETASDGLRRELADS